MLTKVMRVLSAAVVTSLIAVLVVSPTDRAEALSGSEFDPGYIISDAQFYATDAMSEAQIQSFLDAQVGTCRNTLCLNVLRINTTTTTLAFGTCARYQGEANESAARMIYKVQQACAISAKVLLVTLQKEQGLVTSKAPTEAVLRKALGQGCPDTAQCDSAYYGFFMQVYSAARQFAWYGNQAGSHTSIKVGQINSIRFHPNAACGSSAVNIKNRATAALYYYTPYQPNGAALANLGGVGDGCSSYGNRNFWVYYTNWFGSPNREGDPLAHLDVLAAVPGGIRIAGWALDSDSPEPIQVHVYVNGVGSVLVAKDSRPDVGAAWPSVGSAHGFDVTLASTKVGPQDVCVYAINVGPGANTQIRCATLPGMTGSPVGSLDSVVAVTGGVKASGWAIDPDTARAIPVHMYVDSVGSSSQANVERPDLRANYSKYGTQHGFDFSVTAPPGVHNVCVYGIEAAGLGANRQIGCKTVTVSDGSPVGYLEAVTVSPGFVTARGWALDPDTAESIPVHVYAGSRGAAATANLGRRDVGAAYPGYGDLHGYEINLPATPGIQKVCAYGLNVQAPGANGLLGCQSVLTMSGSPVGAVDSVNLADGVILARGWAYDPDTAQSIPVHIYVDSSLRAVIAGERRADVGSVYPAYGPNHGYSVEIPASGGPHNVCIYAINTGPGNNVLLSCETVQS